jgi:hypothetical protein
MTVYLDAAVRQLKAQGYPVRDEDMARLSLFVHKHLGVHGAYNFLLPDLAPGATVTWATLTHPTTKMRADNLALRRKLSEAGLQVREPGMSRVRVGEEFGQVSR